MQTYEQRLEIFQKTAKLVREWNAEHDSTKVNLLRYHYHVLIFEHSLCLVASRHVDSVRIMGHMDLATLSLS